LTPSPPANCVVAFVDVDVDLDVDVDVDVDMGLQLTESMDL